MADVVVSAVRRVEGVGALAQSADFVAHGGEFPDAFLEVVQVPVEERGHVAARRSVVFPDRDDVSDLSEGEAGGLGGADEVQPAERGLVVVAVPGGAAAGLGEHTGLFVEAQGLGRQAASVGELSDAHGREPTP